MTKTASKSADKSEVKENKEAKEQQKKIEAAAVAAGIPLGSLPMIKNVPAVKENMADKIWGMISNIPLEIFALPNQTLQMHCNVIPVTPDALYITLKSTAALPALEEAVLKVKLPSNQQWDVSQAGAYTVIKIVPKL